MLARLTDWFRRFRYRGENEFADLPAEEWELWSVPVRYLARLALVFLLLFAGVYVAFRWSGAAVNFGSLRVSGRATPTWQVNGVVKDRQTRQPIPWARVEDDPAGRPPFFSADADRDGRFLLLTLAEPHRVRVSAPNYVTTLVDIGRVWFLWTPRGGERRELLLEPLLNSTPR
jgi:hypothetical protein